MLLQKRDNFLTSIACTGSALQGHWGQAASETEQLSQSLWPGTLPLSTMPGIASLLVSLWHSTAGCTVMIMAAAWAREAAAARRAAEDPQAGGCQWLCTGTVCRARDATVTVTVSIRVGRGAPRSWAGPLASRLRQEGQPLRLGASGLTRTWYYAHAWVSAAVSHSLSSGAALCRVHVSARWWPSVQRRPVAPNL